MAVKPSPIVLSSVASPAVNTDVEGVTVFENENFNEVIGATKTIIDGFESDNVLQNVAAGQAVAQLIRAVTSQKNADHVLQLAQGSLPILANTLESQEAMRRVADSLRLLANILESHSFQMNSASGMRFACKAIEDDNLSGALASGMDVASRIIEQPAVNVALEKGGRLATSIMGSPKVQGATKSLLESDAFNTTLNTTVKTGISIAQTLSKNERVCDVTRRGIDAVTSIMDNKSAQQVVKDTVGTTASMAQKILDNQALGNAAAVGANMATTVITSDVVTNAASATYELAKAVLTSNTLANTWSTISNTFNYFVTVQLKLEQLETELAELEVAAATDLENLKAEETILAEQETSTRVIHEEIRSVLYENRRAQNRLEARLKTKRNEVEKARQRLAETLEQQAVGLEKELPGEKVTTDKLNPTKCACCNHIAQLD